MTRQISADGIKELFSDETGHVFLYLMEIDHANMPSPIRVVDNNEDITHNGNTYLAFPFEITLASDTEENIPTVNLKFDNIDRRIIDDIRSITTAPDIELEVVRVDEAGNVSTEIGPSTFKMNKVNYDSLTITAELGYEADYLNEPAVKDRFDPAVAPGLFS